MLNVSICPQRDFLPANSETNQKLFVMLKLMPSHELASVKANTHFVFVLDTSGSMYEVIAGDPRQTGRTYSVDGKAYNEVTGGFTKLDIVIDSLNALIDSGRLNENDKVGLVQFDDSASTLAPLTSSAEASALKDAIARLREFSGGTCMSRGISEARKLFSTSTEASKRILLFTDGQTIDEEECHGLASELSQASIPITALGVGDYNEDLLTKLADTTAGRLYHVSKDHENAVKIEELPELILEEFKQAQQDVVTNLELNIRTVRGVTLTKIRRVFPDRANCSLEHEPYKLGNVSGQEETVFILDFDVVGRPVGRARVAQIGLTYNLPGGSQRHELPLQDLVAQFVVGQTAVQMDPEVTGYVQQANAMNLLDMAAQEVDPDKAKVYLDTAADIATKMKDESLRKTIRMAGQELDQDGQISKETRKTVRMASRGKTVRMSDDTSLDEFSEDDIKDKIGL